MFIFKYLFNSVSILKEDTVKRPEFNEALNRIEKTQKDALEDIKVTQKEQHKEQNKKMDDLSKTLHGATQAFIAAGSKDA